MGLIRKSLYLGTSGLVAPNSKKQRQQKQILAAIQGATPAEVKRAGGRYDFNGFWGQPPASVSQRSSGPSANRGPAERQESPRSPEMVQAPSQDADIPKPPSGRGWKLANIQPSAGTPDECPRCHRRGPYVKIPGQPHFTTRRRTWCPGTRAVDYVYRDGYLHPVVNQQHVNAEGAAAGISTMRNPAERLTEVIRLHDAGLLTDAEYEAKRAQIIDGL